MGLPGTVSDGILNVMYLSPAADLVGLKYDHTFTYFFADADVVRFEEEERKEASLSCLNESL